jgi:hypothetical protein
MDFEHEENPECFAGPAHSDAASRLPAVEARLRTVTSWLQEVRIPNDTIMLNCFNEAVRIATGGDGVTGSYMRICELYWHIVDALKKLHEKTQATTHFIPKPLPARKPCAGEEFIEDQHEALIKCDAFPVGVRLCDTTSVLHKEGINPSDLMIGYFNSYLRVASETMEPMRVYTLTCQLYWHVAKLIRKLYEATGAISLPELPVSPPAGKPPANDPPGDGGAAA